MFAAGKVWTREDAEAVIARGADVVALGRAAICNPDWPRRVRAGAEIAQPPLSPAALGERAVSPTFVEYLRNWKGFVAS